jgi:[ribosomal protein S18]-alanine N-acetyltransferase
MTEIVRVGADEAGLVDAAAHLFDNAVDADARDGFLADSRHHLLMARVEGAVVGFVSGVETIHPDKGTEMLLYELAVAPEHRRHGVGAELVRSLGELATERGCYGMWVLTDDDNGAALATYRSVQPSEESRHVMLTWEPPSRTS